MNLRTATPAQIDTVLAEIEGRYYAADAARDREIGMLEMYERRPFGMQSMIESTKERIAKLKIRIAEIRAEALPYEDEYRRRGGWTRYFLVNNNNGHIHNGTGCSTCRPTTRYMWLVELADKPAAELYAHDAYGAMVCTTCYPDAPVDAAPKAKPVDGKCEGRPVGGARLYQKCTDCAHVGSARGWRRHKPKTAPSI